MAWRSRSEYDELRELGRGGFGQVKLVRKKVGTGELYVVKEVNIEKVAENCGDDPDLVRKVVEMTELEAANMQALKNDYIVTVYGHFKEMYLGCMYYHMVMEYCPLGDLAKAIRDNAKANVWFAEKEIRRWSRQLSSALKRLHDHNFVHRDIKPANIFLTAKNNSDRKSVKLGDFGIGKEITESSTHLQSSITNIGTPAYLPPESYQTPPQPYTMKSDVWGFGVVVYELAALKRPFQSKFGPGLIPAKEILNDEPPEIPEHYSSTLREFTKWLLTKNPDERPSMNQVAEHRAVSHKPTESTPSSIAAPAVGTPITSDDDNSAVITKSLKHHVSLPPTDEQAQLTRTKVASRPASAEATFARRPDLGLKTAKVGASSKQARGQQKAAGQPQTDETVIVAARTKPKPTIMPTRSGTPSAAGSAEQTTVASREISPAKPLRSHGTSPSTSKKPLIAPARLSSPKQQPPATLKKPELPTVVIRRPTNNNAPPSKVPSSLTSNIQSSSKGSSGDKKQSAVPKQSETSLTETLLIRKDNFAIKSNYQRNVKNPSTAKAPESFTMTKRVKLPVADPAKTSVSGATDTLSEELKIYSDRSRVFDNVDRHALEVSKTQHRSFRDLIWDLIYSQKITDNLEKARALFLWLCAKDLSNLNFTSSPPDSPESILMQLKSRTRSYASVFELMCSYSNLQCNVISGVAKGVGYHVGMKIAEHKDDHAHIWCSVFIDDKWRLVDPNWGARAFITSQSTLRYELDEFYFLTPPDQFIHTHFPDDAKWQLLPKPISMADFENLSYLSSVFFKLGLKPKEKCQKLYVAAPNGRVTIGIKQDKKLASTANLDFMYQLKKQTGECEEVINGTKVWLNQCVFQEVDYSSRQACYSLRLPSTAAYVLTLFGKSEKSAAAEKGTHTCIGQWIVQAKGTMPPSTVEFPRDSRNHNPALPIGKCWGGLPPEESSRRGLSKCPSKARFEANKATGIVKIVLEKANAQQAISFQAELYSTNPKLANSDLLEHRVLIRVVDQTKVIITAALPSYGEFGLAIFSSLPDEQNQMLPFLCQYLLEWNAGSSKSQIVVKTLRFPITDGQNLGLKKQTSVDVKTISHKDPFIVAEDCALSLELVFESAKPLNASAQLSYYEQPEKSEDFSQFVLHQCVVSQRQEIFVCRFPRPGMYMLQIYGKYADPKDKSTSIPSIYICLINVGGADSNKRVAKFPKQYNAWSSGYLSEPLDGVLEKARFGNEIKVRLAIERANKVAANFGDNWTQLELGKDGYWQAQVNIKEAWGNTKTENELTIGANFDATNATTFANLLAYNFKP